MVKTLSIYLGIASIAVLLGIGMVFPAMAEYFPLKIVSNLNATQDKLYVSVDFDNNGICDENAVLISVSTIQKIGIDQRCVLPSI